MSKEEILKKAIEKAVRNGYKLYRTISGVDEIMTCYTGYESHDIEHLIFNHDFAKAFWGHYCDYCIELEKNMVPGVIVPDHPHNPGWRYYLQQMVLEEDPISYLEQFI